MPVIDEAQHHVVVDAEHVGAQAGVDGRRLGARHRSAEGSIARCAALEVRHAVKFPTPPLAKIGSEPYPSTIPELSAALFDSGRVL